MKAPSLYQTGSETAMCRNNVDILRATSLQQFFADPRLCDLNHANSFMVLQIIDIAKLVGDGQTFELKLSCLLRSLRIGFKRWTNTFLPMLLDRRIVTCESEGEDPKSMFVTIRLADWIRRSGGDTLQHPQTDSQFESADASRSHSGNGRHYSESKEAVRKREQRYKSGTSESTMSHFAPDDPGQMSGLDVGHVPGMSHDKAEMSHFGAHIGTHVSARPSDRSIDDDRLIEDRLIDKGDSIDRSIRRARGVDLPPSEEAKVPVKISEHKELPRLELPPRLEPIYDEEAHWTDAEVRAAIAKMQIVVKRKGEKAIGDELAYLKTTLANSRAKVQSTRGAQQSAQERMSLLSIETGTPPPTQKPAHTPDFSRPNDTSMRDLAAENMVRLKRLGIVPSTTP